MSIQKTITPIDNSVYLERPLSTQNEIDNVIDNSKKIFQSWKSTSIDDRIKIINKFIDNLIALKPEVSKEICWQIGRPISQCGNELRGFEERSSAQVLAFSYTTTHVRHGRWFIAGGLQGYAWSRRIGRRSRSVRGRNGS